MLAVEKAGAALVGAALVGAVIVGAVMVAQVLSTTSSSFKKSFGFIGIFQSEPVCLYSILFGVEFTSFFEFLFG